VIKLLLEKKLPFEVSREAQRRRTEKMKISRVAKLARAGGEVNYD